MLLLLSRFSHVQDSVRPHSRQLTRLPHPWDSLGKNTGVGCHFLLQCMKVKSQSEVAQLCPTLSDPRDCSPPGSSVHGIFQARVLEWGAIAFCVLRLTRGKMRERESLSPCPHPQHCFWAAEGLLLSGGRRPQGSDLVHSPCTGTRGLVFETRRVSRHGSF